MKALSFVVSSALKIAAAQQTSDPELKKVMMSMTLNKIARDLEKEVKAEKTTTTK